MLVRTVFIESVGRYDRLFSQNPPTYFAQYVERVAMVKGRLDRKASTATGYGWAVWEKSDIRIVSLHATVMASGSLTYLVGRTTLMSFGIIR